MSIPQPKILTAVTVPTGGWVMDVLISDAVAFDTTVTITIPAGDYFMAWDHQSDDFLHVFCKALADAIVALGGIWVNGRMSGSLQATTHYTQLTFHGSVYSTATRRQVKLKFSTKDGASIAKVLGWTHTADASSTASNYPTLTSDHHHGYGWYADDDGLIEDLLTEDASSVIALQSVAHSGKVVSQLISERFTNTLALRWLPRNKTFSQAIDYGGNAVYPYLKNVGLESWWESAKSGTRFRVYRDGVQDITRATRYTRSAGTTTTATISGVALATLPQQHKSRLLYQGTFNVNGTAFPERWFITSHTATVFTVPNADSSTVYTIGENDSALYVFDQPYQTYVVDLDKMKKFEPREAARHGLFDVDVPLLRYV